MAASQSLQLHTESWRCASNNFLLMQKHAGEKDLVPAIREQLEVFAAYNKLAGVISNSWRNGELPCLLFYASKHQLLGALSIQENAIALISC